MTKPSPRIVVFSTLFPNPNQPNAGVFIRERMFRVGKKLPIVVVAPAPWFPFQGLIRKFKPHFRPECPVYEEQQGIQVYHPRFFCIPGIFKFLDGFFMALGSYRLMQKLKKEFAFNIIDAHFAYPDGLAATRLGRWFNVPVTITLRGTEVPHAKRKNIKSLLVKALNDATHIFSVSTSLKKHVIELGVSAEKIQVVGNGVDIDKFYPTNRRETREVLKIDNNTSVLITVGALVERKGFHRVLEILPQLKEKFPNIVYLIVGGASAEGNWMGNLRQQVEELQLDNNVIFTGPKAPDELKNYLSAADLFVLPTSNEGWANVLLEAMACGLPIVTTDVGGNKEVVCEDFLGTVIPFGDSVKLYKAVDQALEKHWDKNEILSYARANNWDNRVELLEQAFKGIIGS